MTQTKTKKALLMSVLSMVLCVAMLVGMTFAWFTDTASTAVNTIKSGNLDVELWQPDKDAKLEVTSLAWEKANNVDEEVLWEPGATYNLEKFRIKNNGDLALKYKIVVSGLTGDATLLEAIDFTVSVEGGLTAKDGTTVTPKTIQELNNFEGQLLPKAVTGKITITGKMKEEAGNDYQKKAIENIAITVYATQLNYESDSTGSNYDIDAAYPAISQDELSAAIADGKSNITLASGNYTLYNVNNSKTQGTTLTLTGAGADKTTFSIGKPVPDQQGEYNADYSYENSDVTFKDMTVSMGTGNYKGIVRAKSLYFENCTIKGMGSYWGSGNVTFKNCKFADNGDYNLWTYAGTDFTFDGCTFESSVGKFINAYKEQRVDSTLTFKNCEFKYTGEGTASKPAVCLKSYTGIIWNATFDGCTSNAATDSGTGSNLYSIENGMNAETTVKIDGKVVWENGAKK